MTERASKKLKKEEKEENDERKHLTVEELEVLLKNDEKVQVGGTDIDGVLRGKIMKKSKFLGALKEGFGFCGVVFGWDIGDKAYDNVTIASADNGFKDFVAKIDTSTMRRVPWKDNMPFFNFDFYREDGKPVEACPRNLLKTVLKDLHDHGFHAYSALEFEFFNYKETPYTLEEKGYKDLSHLTPGMFGYSILRPTLYQEFFNDLYNLTAKFDIPIEGLHTETGPGVYEVAIEYTDALTAADRGQLFKTAAKEIGMKYGIMPSFMAKPNPNLPGCSGHAHYSLWDLEKKHNLFWDEKDSKKMSETMKQFIAGQLYCLPYILPMMVPNINSYKRFVEGAWAPVVLSWGIENRTSALRVINPNQKGIRVETRVGGADINSYLAIAAALAAGLYGIKNKLVLQEESLGDNLADPKLPKLPTNLMDANRNMAAKDSVARKLFGDAFVDHFSATREWEWRQFQRAVTDWETKRYFELV